MLWCKQLYISTNVYLGKDRQNATQTMTATHATIRNLTRRVEGVGKCTVFASSPDKFDDPYTRGTNYCGAVR
jgi:hypothetical protein